MCGILTSVGERNTGCDKMRKIWPSSYGTFPMGLYKDDNNELWVRKQGANLAHIKNEYEFMKYLDFIGGNVPECFMDDRYLYTKFIDGEVMGTNPSREVAEKLFSYVDSEMDADDSIEFEQLLWYDNQIDMSINSGMIDNAVAIMGQILNQLEFIRGFILQEFPEISPIGFKR